MISPLAQITLTCETLQQRLHDRAHQGPTERPNKENQLGTVEWYLDWVGGWEQGVGVQVAKNSVLQQMCKQLQAYGIANDTNYITMPTQYLHMLTLTVCTQLMSSTS